MYPAGTSIMLELAKVALAEVVAATLVDVTLIVPVVIVTFPNVKLLRVVVVLLAATDVLPSVMGNPVEVMPVTTATVFNMISLHHRKRCKSLQTLLPHLQKNKH